MFKFVSVLILFSFSTTVFAKGVYEGSVENPKLEVLFIGDTHGCVTAGYSEGVKSKGGGLFTTKEDVLEVNFREMSQVRAAAICRTVRGAVKYRILSLSPETITEDGPQACLRGSMEISCLDSHNKSLDLSEANQGVYW